MSKIKKLTRNRNKILLGTACVCAAGLFVCLFVVIRNCVGRYQSGKEMERLKNTYITQDSPSRSGTPVATGASEDWRETERKQFLAQYQVPDKTIDFEALKEKENADIYAWITIPGTLVDYPVLRNSEDADYYLDHNLDGTKGYPGCIYTELYNSGNWEDPNTVLYGHDMKNGTMFGSLQKYEDKEFFDQNSYVYIYSPDAIRVYRVFAAYEASDEHLIRDKKLEDSDTYSRYLNGIYSHSGESSNFNKDVSVTKENKLLTLSTCIKNRPDIRYLVQAVLTADWQ